MVYEIRWLEFCRGLNGCKADAFLKLPLSHKKTEHLKLRVGFAK